MGGSARRRPQADTIGSPRPSSAASRPISRRPGDGSNARQSRPSRDSAPGTSCAGFVEEIRIDGLLAQVRLRVGDYSLTAVITADAVRALRLKRGDDALAIIKSTEVMIGKSGLKTIEFEDAHVSTSLTALTSSSGISTPCRRRRMRMDRKWRPCGAWCRPSSA